MSDMGFTAFRLRSIEGISGALTMVAKHDQKRAIKLGKILWNGDQKINQSLSPKELLSVCREVRDQVEELFADIEKSPEVSDMLEDSRQAFGAETIEEMKKSLVEFVGHRESKREEYAEGVRFAILEAFDFTEDAMSWWELKNKKTT